MFLFPLRRRGDRVRAFGQGRLLPEKPCNPPWNPHEKSTSSPTRPLTAIGLGQSNSGTLHHVVSKRKNYASASKLIRTRKNCDLPVRRTFFWFETSLEPRKPGLISIPNTSISQNGRIGRQLCGESSTKQRVVEAQGFYAFCAKLKAYKNQERN